MTKSWIERALYLYSQITIQFYDEVELILLSKIARLIMNKITFANWKDRPMESIFAGIQFCELWQNKAGSKAVVVKIEPGGKWQGWDKHETASEEIFVLEGTFNDGERDYPAGTFIHNPIGSQHIPQSNTGCLLFIFYPDVSPRNR